MSTAISVTFALSLLVFLCDSTGGLRTMPGGWSDYDTSSNSETYNAVVRLANKYLTDNQHVGQSCANSSLRPSNVKTQVVAGTNYQLTYTIPSSCSGNGAPLTCTIFVYQSLPYRNEAPQISTNRPPVCQ